MARRKTLELVKAYGSKCTRGLLAAIAAVVITIGSSSVSRSDQAVFNSEQNTDRPGGDYKRIELQQADYRACQSRCAMDDQCRAYTYVSPGIQGPSAQCYLKSQVPVAQSAACCVSGVRGGAPGQQPGTSATGLESLAPAIEMLTGRGQSPSSGTTPTVDAGRPPAGSADLPQISVDTNQQFSRETNVNRRGGDYRRFIIDKSAIPEDVICEDACRQEAQCRAYTLFKAGTQRDKATCYLKETVTAPEPSACCSSGVRGTAQVTNTGQGAPSAVDEYDPTLDAAVLEPGL